MSRHVLQFDSPLGEVVVVSDGTGLVRVGRAVEGESLQGDPDAVCEKAREQLAEYFAGTRTAFDLPLAATGTEWQRRVWAELVRIPFGETRSYGQLAASMSRPTASRAVGAANGRNPLWIVVPCHRVIGADGGLTGYAGGLECKRWLLEHEKGARG